MLTQLFAFLYKRVLKPIVFLFDAEFVHDHFTMTGEFLGKFAITKAIIRSIYKYKGKDISTTVNGITYSRPVILSAGFDYNGHLTTILDDMSFGGVEVGSVTFRPCEGNKKPRLSRAKKSKSIIVWKGLRNDGVHAVAKRLKARQSRVGDLVIGISIAKTNDANCISVQEGIDDYIGSLTHLIAENIGDYYTINISCPNAFGGEDFTNPESLKLLLTAVKKNRDARPVYVKLPINLPWPTFKILIDVVRNHEMDGVVIGNLNKDYRSLEYQNEAPKEFRGGLSGKPCQELSTLLIAKTREYVGHDFTIIGVGGILKPADALEKIDAGANLVMLITGMIFEGPHLMKQICEAIEERKYATKR